LWARTALVAAAACVAGCEDRPSPSHYSVLAGNVVACRTDTGELRVHASRRTAEGPREETFHCLLTRDSEVYIDDRLSSIEEIQLGDAVELVGRWERGPQLERFAVSFAYFDHPLPVPPRPEFAPASAPATEDRPGQQPQGEN
jgi:hypothetical protein